MNVWIFEVWFIMSLKKKDQRIATAHECFTGYGYKKIILEDIGKK